MNKVYPNRINWENLPSEETPLNETNLNKMDYALYELDDRLIVQDATKATKTEVAPLIANVTFNEKTGIFTFTKKDGSTFTLDTLLEKVIVNFSFDRDTQKIILIMEDGAKEEIDLSAFIAEYEFADSDTVAFTLLENHKITAKVKEGSVQEKHLQPNYLADIKVVQAKAQANQEAAETAQGKAEDFSLDSEAWAKGTRGGVNVPSTDETYHNNAYDYSELAKTYMNTWKGSLLPQGKIAFSQIPTSGMEPGYLYDITDGFVSDSRFADGAGYSYPAGTNIFWNKDGKWDVIYGILTKELTQAEYDALSDAEKLNGTIYYISDVDVKFPSATYYGTCPTEPTAQVKIATVSPDQNFELKVGVMVGIKFTNTNTYSATAAAPCRLNVNNTGEKNIWYSNTGTPTGTNATAFGSANRYNWYQYDGTYWVWMAQSVDNNTTYSTMSIAELTTGSLTTARVVRADYLKAGISALGTQYGTCPTAAATAAKVVTLNDSNFILRVGATIAVKFTYTNTAQNPTLNVNNTGAKPIWYNTAAITTGSLGMAGTANRIMQFVYDGTYWVWIGWSIDSNTTYSAMSQSEANAGTATTARSVTAAVLKTAIETHSVKTKELTQAQYDALSSTEKMNGTIYFISD